MNGFPPRSDPFLPTLPHVTVQRVPAFRATKPYVCPDCHHAVAVGQGHVVAWPEGLVEDRRHWHLHCWRMAVRRGRIA